MTEADALVSIIIVSYNTGILTINCIKSVATSIDNNISYEIILVDNNSTDDTIEKINKLDPAIKKRIKVINNQENSGYSRANNQGIKEAKGKYVLFLNSDTIVPKDFKWKEVLGYLGMNKGTGALTVKVVREDGRLDPASHRGFPTLWRSFTYFSGLEKLSAATGFFKNKLGGYHLLDKNPNSIHEIDSPSGAFFLVKKEVLDKTGGFDERFFMYGEDLDLAWRIKESGYKIEFYPHMEIIHLKYRSGLAAKSSAATSTKTHFYKAMKLFFQKHYSQRNPAWVNKLVYQSIDILCRIKK